MRHNTEPQQRRARRSAPIGPASMLLAALVVALCVAACGGSSTTTKAAAKSAQSDSRAAFTSCLKQHGVTVAVGAGRFRGKFHGKFKKGSGPGGGFGGGTPPAGARTGGGFFGARSAKQQAAFKACASKLPASERHAFGAGGFGRRPGGLKPHFSTAVLDKFVACIRKNGYASMPDPKRNSTTGAFFPKSVENNAAFKKALPKCESIIRQAYQPSASSTGTTSNS